MGTDRFDREALKDGVLIPRREFIARAGGTLMATMAIACGGGNDQNFVVTPPPATGSLTVTVTGLTAAAANGGKVDVQLTDPASPTIVTVTLPASGTQTQGSIPLGTYSVTYTVPDGFYIAGGTQKTAAKTGILVTAATPGTATFAVVVAPTFPTPDILNNVSFETDFGGFRDGGGNQPTGVLRSTAKAFAGGTALTRKLPITTYAIVSNTKANPTVIFAPGSNIPTGTTLTIGGNIGSSPSINSSFVYTATNIDADHFSIPVDTSGGLGGLGGIVDFDVSAQCFYRFYFDGPGKSFDRLWGRFYFYLDAAIDGVLKFQIWEAAGFNGQFGGLFLHGGSLGWAFLNEAQGYTHPLAPLAPLVGAWHSLEVDYWRNGDPSGFPSVAIWLDGVQFTVGSAPTGAPSFWSNGRLQAGERLEAVKQLGTYNFLGVLNGGPGNTIPANIYIDQVSLSSLGRIGP